MPRSNNEESVGTCCAFEFRGYVWCQMCVVCVGRMACMCVCMCGVHSLIFRLCTLGKFRIFNYLFIYCISFVADASNTSTHFVAVFVIFSIGFEIFRNSSHLRYIWHLKVPLVIVCVFFYFRAASGRSFESPSPSPPLRSCLFAFGFFLSSFVCHKL